MLGDSIIIHGLFLSTYTRFTDLHFLSVLADYLHQPGQQVGDGPGGDGLPEGPEHLEGTSGIVTGRAAQGRLQRHVAELLLQVQI